MEYNDRKSLIRLASSLPVGSSERRLLLSSLVVTGSSHEIMETISVGDIFVSSWGYDQTNIDFYEVARKTRTMVVLRKVAKKVVGGQGGPSVKVVPIPGAYEGPPTRKKVKLGWRGHAWIDLTSYSGASLWDGKPQTQTGSMYGR